MKQRTVKVALMATAATLLPLFSFAQGGVASDIHSLQGVLDNLYNQMIPLCSQLIGVGQGIAGFAAMWYIAVRVWKHIAAAEPIDFYPLLKPFVIGFAILNFTSVLALINGVLQPTVTATESMVTNANQAIENMLNQSEQQQEQTQAPTNINSDPTKWYQYSHPDNPSGATSTNPIADQFSGFGIKNYIKKLIYEFLNVLFESAALCIDTIRTFKLIVLAILGPLCFGLGVFDGFQHTIKQWLARYINVFMWLPVANIFGAIIARIQENMISLQQSGGSTNPTFGDTNTAYLIFMVIGIVGYFCVPGIANYIVNAGGHALFSKTAALTSSVVAFSSGQIIQGIQDLKQMMKSGKEKDTGSSNSGSGNVGAGYMKDKLSGKT